MKLLKIKQTILLVLITLTFTCFCNAQQGTVIVNQDSEITRLLELKKEISTNEDASDRYKIQIYSGRRGGAEKAQSDYRGAYTQWSSKMVHETPNYKIWVGSFRSHLEADRALLKIKRKFPNAFRFKPKKDKD